MEEPASQLIDLSHCVEDGMITYKGLPAPVICDYLSREASRARYAPGTEFQIGKIEMVANTGTYIDSPFHRYAMVAIFPSSSWKSLAKLDCVVVARYRARRTVHRRDGRDRRSARKGRAFSYRLGCALADRSIFRRSPVSHGATRGRIGRGRRDPRGIDSFNIDCTDTGERPVHSALLGAGIPIVEHLRGLEALPDRGARFYAVPVKVKGMGTFPIRAFARLTTS